MKKILFFIALMFVAAGALHAQNINLAPEKVQEFLSKRWEMDYAILGEQKIGKAQGAPAITFDIKKDKTFTISGNFQGDGKKANGTWNYNVKQKRVELNVEGDITHVTTLSENQFIMFIDMSANEKVKMFFKPMAK